VDQAHQTLVSAGADVEHASAQHPIGRAVQRLELAGQSMRRMAEYLEQTMADGMATPRSGTGMGSGSQFVQPGRTLGEVVDEVCRLLTPITEPLGIVVSTHLTPDAADLPIGPLEAVLLNALRNAIDACARAGGESGEIELVASRRQEMLRIVIADTGAGLSPNRDQDTTIARGEEPFTQHGHGLGLRICRRIVHDLGGDLRVMNIPFGRGAVFHVQVPVNRLPAA